MKVEDLVFVTILWFLNFTCFITCCKIFEFEVLQVVLTWHPSYGGCGLVCDLDCCPGLARRATTTKDETVSFLRNYRKKRWKQR